MKRETGFVALLLVLIAVVISASGVSTRVDHLIFDVGQRLTPRSVPDDLAIVAIDEDSLGRIGRWPWPRDVHARLLKVLCASRPAAIGVDIAFSEHSLEVTADAALARAVADCGRVVLPMVIETSGTGGQLLESPPIPELVAVVAGLGRVGVRLDEDGIARSVDLREGVGSAAWPLFAEELLRIGDRPSELTVPDKTGGRGNSHALVSEGNRRFEFAGSPGTIPRISYAEVLEGKVPAAFFTGKTVLVGVTAVGLGDFLPTPVSARAQPMPGVEVQANIWLSMRDRRLITVAPIWASTLFCALLALLPTLWLPRLMPLLGLLTSTVWLVVLGLFSALLPEIIHAWFAPSGALFAALSAFPLWSWRRLEAARRHLDQELRQLGEALPGHDESSDAVRHMGFEQRIAWVQAAQQRMLSLEKQRNEALAFISHDLRSPLASAVQRLESQPCCDSATLLPSLQRASNLAQDFLRLARAEALNPRRMKELELGSVLQQAVDEVYLLMRQRALSIARTFPDDPVWINGDFDALERCAINLLQNALAYAPAATTIRVGMVQSSTDACFWVENEGVALEDDQIERLFQRFSRGEHSTVNPASTGLGLYYVRTVAEKHGGRVGVECANGQVRFWISLPAKLPSMASAPPA